MGLGGHDRGDLGAAPGERRVPGSRPGGAAGAGERGAGGQSSLRMVPMASGSVSATLGPARTSSANCSSDSFFFSPRTDTVNVVEVVPGARVRHSPSPS